MRGALVNQPGLFGARDHADRVAQDLVGLLDEDVAVLGFAQRLGGYGAYLGGRKAFQALGKARQAIPAALHGFTGKVASLVQACPLAYHFLEILHAFDMTGGVAPNLKAKTVGSQIHSGKQGSIEHRSRHQSSLQK